MAGPVYVPPHVERVSVDDQPPPKAPADFTMNLGLGPRRIRLGTDPLRCLGAQTLIIGAVLALSRPRGARADTLTPRGFAGSHVITAVPEVGTTIVVYGCLIAGFLGAITVVGDNVLIGRQLKLPNTGSSMPR